MPVKRCQRDGKPGWKWGDQGYCYIGSDARERALAQGRAIQANRGKDIDDLPEETVKEMVDNFNKDIDKIEDGKVFLKDGTELSSDEADIHLKFQK